MKIDFKAISHLANAYRPKGVESYSCVEVDDIDAGNPYLPVYLREWSFLVAVGGSLTLRLKNPRKSYRLLRLCDIFIQSFKLVNPVSGCEPAKEIRLCKQSSDFHPDDCISKWTIGLITNGSRPEFVEKFCSCLSSQNVPIVELIICGFLEQAQLSSLRSLLGGRGMSLRYIEFKEKDELGWITRKKNIVCKSATYQNIAIFHDRFVLEHDWYIEVKKYGKKFDALAVKNIGPTGKRQQDWAYITNHYSRLHNFSVRHDLLRPYLLNSEDWSPNGYISGGVTVLKKRCWEAAAWDDRLFWVEGEDVVLSNNLLQAGYVSRYANTIVVKSLVEKGSGAIELRFGEGATGLRLVNKFKDCVSIYIRSIPLLRRMVYSD